MEDKPQVPIFNYDGIGSNKIIDYFGIIFRKDSLTGEYVEEDENA